MRLRLSFERTEDPPGWLVSGGPNFTWGHGETLEEAMHDWVASFVALRDSLDENRDRLGRHLQLARWQMEAMLPG